MATRRVVVQRWKEVSDQLVRQGQLQLAREARALIAQLPLWTEKELIKGAILRRSRTRGSEDRQR
ncbi:MAG: hypothetical protein ACRDQZ_11230 [Mycobacteriales bacterium]